MEIPKEIERDYNLFLNRLHWLEISAQVFEKYVDSLHNAIDAIHEDMDAMEYVAKKGGDSYHALYQFFREFMLTHDTNLMQIATNFTQGTKSLNSMVTELGNIEHKISNAVRDKAYEALRN